MKNLRDFTYDDLLLMVKELGEKPYRAGQLFGWIFHRDAPDIDSMTDTPKALRERLKEEFYIGGITVLDVKRSSDGTRKFLSALEDGSRIESVLIPETGRLTLCVSTQVGCALGLPLLHDGDDRFYAEFKPFGTGGTGLCRAWHS